MESRRSFIKKTGLTSIGTILLTDPFVTAIASIVNIPIDDLLKQFSHTCDIIRPTDFLYHRYYFVNIEVRGRKLTKINFKSDAFIIVRIPQQHIGEEIHKSNNPNEDWSINNNCGINFPGDREPFDLRNKLKDFSKSFVSGFSYMTFRLKKNQDRIAYNQTTLTNWNLFDLLTLQDLESYPKDFPVMLLVSNNTYPIFESNFPIEVAVAKINNLFIPITIIEAPYKIFLSPASLLRRINGIDYRYQFSKDNSIYKYYPHPRTQSNYKLTELWNNDLIFQVTHPIKGISKLPPNFKIIAYEETPEGNTYLLPDPTKKDRSYLAFLTNINEDKRDIYSDYFNISSLGVSTQLHYENLDSKDKKIVKWFQEIKLGRDNHVEITTECVDARTGLKLLVSDIADRIIEKGKSVLIHRKKFKYLDPFKEFTNPLLFNGHIIKKIIAPAEGAYFVGMAIDNGEVLLDECTQALLKKTYRCFDANGNELPPLDIDLFIIRKEVFKSQVAVENTLREFNNTIIGFYTEPKTYQFDHSINVKNLKISFCPENNSTADTSKQSTNSSLVTTELQFYSVYGGAFNDDYPVLPRLKYAKVFIPQLEGIESLPAPRLVNYCESYLNNGFSEKNISKVFLQTLADDFYRSYKFPTIDISKRQDDIIIADIKSNALKSISNVFSDNYKNAGSLINPDIVIDNISILKQGITLTDEINNRVSDITNIRPADILRGMNVEILGGIDLKKILKNIIPIADSPIFNLVEEANEGFTKYGQEYKNLKRQVENLQNEIKELESNLKNTTNSKLKTYLEKYYEAREKLEILYYQTDSQIQINSKQIYEIIREKESEFQKELISKLNGIAKTVSEEIKKYFTDIKDQIHTIIYLKQILDAIQKQIYIRNNKRLNNIASGYYDAKVISDLSDLYELKNAYNIIVNSQQLYTTASSKALNELKNVFEKNTLKTFIEVFPSCANSVVLEIVKYHFFELIKTPSTIHIDSKIYDILNKYRAIALGVEIEIDNVSKKYKIQDNIDAFFYFLNEASIVLNNSSEIYYKTFINAYNESVRYSRKFIEAEQRKIEEEIFLLHNQINFEIKNQIDSIWKDGILKTEAYRNVRETFNFLQSTYLEFSKIKSEAERIQNELIGTDLTLFIENYKKNQLPKIEIQIKGLLVTKLQEFIDDIQLDSIKDEINVLKSKVNELEFENINGYIEKFKSIEDKIIEQTVELYLKVDADKQRILSEIESKQNLLKSFESQLKNFLNSKIDELENGLIESNKELIEAYQNGEQAVILAKDKIQKFKNDLNQLRAINKKEIRYTWQTNKFEDVNLGILKFLKGKQSPTELTVDIKNTLHFDITSFPPHLNRITNETISKLSNFSVNFLSILSVEFDNVSFIGGSVAEEKFDVAIRDIRFEGPLNFVKVFQSYLKTIDKGLRIDIAADGAILGYEVCLPDITGGTFNFVNWKLVMDLRLPFKAGVPMRINFGLNTPQEMGLVTGAIWGGRGCLLFGLEPKRGLVSILLIIEVGVVIYLNIGVASGLVYIFAGIYIRKEYDKVELKGYLTCGGVLNILGLITASITFYMGLQGNGNYLEGYCSISYKIKICAFVKISVNMSMYKRIHGCPDNSTSNNTSNFSQNNFGQGYCFNGMTAKFKEGTHINVNSQNMDINRNEFKYSESEWDEFFEANYNKQ